MTDLNDGFIYAKELKTKFNAYGHFYKIKLNDFPERSCRSVLEIVANKINQIDIDSISEKKPDAVFIMMNPGSSTVYKAKASGDCMVNVLKKGQIGQLAIKLVRARPDTTQYQLMRVMEELGWSHVRVLNLSDLIETRSADFVKDYCALEDQTKFEAHSIFSNVRKNELADKLSAQPGVPIFFAWGVNPGLDPLIERCLNQLATIESCSKGSGLPKENSKNRYRHPLPHGKEKWRNWVNEMVLHITKSDNKIRA